LEQRIRSKEVRRRGQATGFSGFSKVLQVNLYFKKKVSERILMRKM